MFHRYRHPQRRRQSRPVTRHASISAFKVATAQLQALRRAQKCAPASQAWSQLGQREPGTPAHQPSNRIWPSSCLRVPDRSRAPWPVLCSAFTIEPSTHRSQDLGRIARRSSSTSAKSTTTNSGLGDKSGLDVLRAKPSRTDPGALHHDPRHYRITQQRKHGDVRYIQRPTTLGHHTCRQRDVAMWPRSPARPADQIGPLIR